MRRRSIGPAELLLVSLLPAVASLIYFVAPVGALAPICYGLTKAAMLAWLLWHCSHGLPRPGPTGPQHRRSLVLGALLGAAMFALIVGLAAGPMHGLVERAGPGVRAKVAQFGIADWYWIFGLLLSVVHSAFEEWYWRRAVAAAWVRRCGPTRGHLLGALAFSLHHMVVIGVYLGPIWGVLLGLAVGIGGWLWSRLDHATGSLWGPWVAHLAADAAIVWIGAGLLAERLVE